MKAHYKLQACLFIAAFISLILTTGCTWEGDPSEMEKQSATYKVVVMMLTSQEARWKETAAWALENIELAQTGMTDKVKLELIFKDQDAEDIDEYMRQVAEDTTIIAIIGPSTSFRAEKMAIQLSKRVAYNKPMISPTATYVQYQRKFSHVPYVWNMAESDITQMEVVLSEIASLRPSEDVTVELLTQDDGQSTDVKNDNAEWFSFIAEEFGLKVSAVHFYKDTDDLHNAVRKVCGPEREKHQRYLFFSPAFEDDAIRFDQEVGQYRDELEKRGMKCFMPSRMYCSDAFVAERIAAVVENMNYEGVDLCASPEAGFIQAYHQRYGREPINGEAQFYDAICIIAYAAKLLQSPYFVSSSRNKRLALNDAVLAVVDGRDGYGGSWLPYDMTRNFQMLANGQTPDLQGVSSSWTFDEKTHASVVGSTYRHWRIDDGQYITTEYISTEGSNRSSSSKEMWNWTASKMQTFSADEGMGLTYPDLDDRWALLIAASKGWANYRFQADVFAMYQLLKQHGYDDDHIVLICEDDVAYHANNPYLGVLRISDTGENLYDADAIDYCLNTLSPSDIGDILQGRASDRLPHVLSPDTDDNVFVFWSSHGSPGSMDFGSTQSMTYGKMREILEATPHRKLLFAIEACYSGGLGEACEGLNGSLFITAANPYETSHADVWSEVVGVYLSNGFTRGFQEGIDENPDISLRDLYYTLARNTTGSHVKVYNALNYGSVYSNTMAEYLK